MPTLDIKTFLTDYYCTHASWSVKKSVECTDVGRRLKLVKRIAAAVAGLSIMMGLASTACADDRRLGLAIADSPTRSYDDAVKLAQSAGVSFTSLSLQWDDIETSPGVYRFDPDWLAIASRFYPSIGWAVALEVNPIDTSTDRRPVWLKGKPWDDSAVIASYREVLREVLRRSKDLKLVSLAVGNEVDGLLGVDAKAWSAYARLVQVASETVKTERVKTKVGVKTTFSGTVGAASDQIAKLSAATGLSLVTYYPLDETFHARHPAVVSKDFQQLTQILGSVEIHIAEVGYPSSQVCAGGPVEQAKFVTEVFKAWDAHAQQITTLNWTWLTDVSQADVALARQYYKVTLPCFTEFIATLGLETAEPKAKLGWSVFASEGNKRFH